MKPIYIINGILIAIAMVGVRMMNLEVTKAEENTHTSVNKTQKTNEQPTQTYKTAREEHLFTKVQKTVDLPGFGDYQDLLASYAYNTCLIKNGDIDGTYSCENLVLTWNSENGGWNYKTFNNTNSNGTSDGGLCQLNNAYHSDFINSKYFDNPLSQLDYCLNVWIDAKKKGTMPRYGFYPRHDRNKGISFTENNSYAGEAQIEQQDVIYGYYDIAKRKQELADKAWEDCKNIGECKE